MVRMLALVEGPTERNFCQRILAPHFGARNIEFHPRVIGLPGHKGGTGSWERAKREMIRLIRQEPRSILTTMFDFYAMPKSGPGRHEALIKGLKCNDAVSFIETKIAEAIAAEFADSGSGIQFIPYLSQHEFEALLFSDLPILADVLQNPRIAQELKTVLEMCGECEKINDSFDTAPSRRILKVAPNYSKTIDGIAAAERIGLQTLRQQCPHFKTWLERLERFAPEMAS